MLISGCGGSGPTAPDLLNEGSSTSGNQSSSNGRYTWGMYDITIDTGGMTSEIVPQRNLEIHYNVLQMLEGWGCLNCVRLTNLYWSNNQTLVVEVTIEHPANPDRLDLTGFDVRGVAIFDAETSFPNHFVRDRDAVEVSLFASRRIINADGYTTHFNRETAYEGTQLYQYRRGRLTHPSEASIVGNLHPFKIFYSHDNRQMFKPGYIIPVEYEIRAEPQTFIKFAYSIDASWSFPLHWPVTEPVWDDFPPSANSREPYQMSMTIDDNFLTQQGGYADVTFDIFDHQGWETISTITLEAPDLFYGVRSIDPAGNTPMSDDQFRYTYTVDNETGYAKTEDGGSDLLIVVEDWGMSVVGEDVRAYNIFTLPVVDVAKTWRPREDTFEALPFPGPGPSGAFTDMTVISDPPEPWAIIPGDSMLVFFNDTSGKYIGYNREFDHWIELAGYPGNWLKPVTRLDAAAQGAFGVISDSDTPVNGEYWVRHCTNMHINGGIYTFSWYTGSLDFTSPYLELSKDLSGGYGNTFGDPIYSLYAFDGTTGYSVPTTVSLHRISEPYDDPSEVLRAYLPLMDDLSGASVTKGVSYDHVVAMGVDDEPDGELNPFTTHVYTGENRPGGGFFNDRELDVWLVNYSYPDGFQHLRTYDSTMLGGGIPWPVLEQPSLVDVDVLPTLSNEIYMGADQYPEHNWVAVLYTFDTAAWYIQIFDVFDDDPIDDWQNPLFLIGPFPGHGLAMDVDPDTFEIYVVHDDLPAGVGSMRLTCLEYF